jgi:hypothetical protein
VRPKNKGLENPAKNHTNPLQNDQTQPNQSTGHNPQLELCPKSIKFCKKFGVGGFSDFFGKNRKKKEMGEKGGAAAA